MVSTLKLSDLSNTRRALQPTKKLTPLVLDIEKNALLAEVLQRVNDSIELKTLWQIANVHAIDRLSMTDHGPVHFEIVARTSLYLTRLLQARKITSSIVRDFNLTPEHAETVVVMASLLHDIGMSVHRKGHEEFSVVLANRLLQNFLDFLPEQERVIMTSEILHAIISHRRDGQPLTLEAGIVRVADALDMTEGRSRIPYDQGKIDIHSVSALAIDEIEIKSGRKTPVEVAIIMNHTAGIFQVDELLKEKVRNSGIEDYLQIKVYIDKGRGRQLFKDFYKQR